MLIDDSPLNLAAALRHGLTVATIAHPWNRDVCEEEDVLVADDWSTRLGPPLLALEMPSA